MTVAIWHSLAQYTEDVSRCRLVGISPVKVKDTHLMNDNLPETEVSGWSVTVQVHFHFKQGERRALENG